MDYFDKQFGNYEASDQSDLPEGFGWEDMRDDIYERMEEEKPAANYKKYWPFLLLLLFVGCGIGSWFALNQNNKNEISENLVNEKINSSAVQESGRDSSTDGNQISDNIVDLAPSESATIGANEIKKVTQSESLLGKLNNKQNNNTADGRKTSTNKISSANNPNRTITKTQIIADNKSQANKIVNEKNLQNKALLKNEFDSNDAAFNNSDLIENNANLIEINTTQLPTLSIEEFPIQSLPINIAITKSSKNKPTVKQQLQFSLSAGVANWTAPASGNIKGYPGYVVNPSVQLFLRPKHALQLDYEFTAIEELFEYNGARPITIDKENVVVEELVSSLTGKVINTERKNITVPGTRTYHEVKYNAYQSHTLSLGYHFASAKKKRSSYGFYLGGSYLFKLNQKGKRLTEELDVVSFDNENPIFSNQQFGLRFGLNYDFSLGEKTALFSQLVATQYLTNWEVETSDAGTKPLFYGLQIGIRQRL